MLTRIKCPLCKDEFALQDAISEEALDQLLAPSQEQHKKELEEARKAAVEETLKKQAATEQQRLDEVRRKTEAEAADKYSKERTPMEKRLAEKDEKMLQEFREQELALRA